jgi:glycosyltransferase involved in cell wall biosynthesis
VKRVLIVSPHFPPVNAPDVQRVRMSLPYYPAFGWQPVVLTVRPEVQEDAQDAALVDTIPADVPVTRTGALPVGLTGTVGIRNVAMRAFLHLYRAGGRLIRRDEIDLVYFSTTMFVSMVLGRLWKRRYGTPYVIDLQDPWFSTYYDDKPASDRPPKYAAARRLHRVLEAWTMRRVDALITVSDAYATTLRARYPWITPEMCTTIPFGASELDFEVAERLAPARPAPAGGTSRVRGVYIGRGGPDMAPALRILFTALRDGRASHPRFADVELAFVGTDYAPAGRARKTVEPVAAETGVAGQVTERTARVPYLEALAGLRQADFIVLIGSDDPQYSASKVYPCILARRPIVAVVHERSPIADVLRRTHAGVVVTFAGREDIAGPASRLAAAWAGVLDRLPAAPDTDWTAFAPYTARSLTERQCHVFDAAVRPRADHVPAPCTD